jgi:hypothetical protein
MTRRVVYGIGIWATLAGTSPANPQPRSLTVPSGRHDNHQHRPPPLGPLGKRTPARPSPSPSSANIAAKDIGGDIKFTYGLHRKCSSVTGVCDPFPTPRDCERDGAAFCALWRSVGFLASLAVLLEAATLVSLAAALAGGVRSRTYGWRVVCALMALAAAAQLAGMAIVVGLPDALREDVFADWRAGVRV